MTKITWPYILKYGNKYVVKEVEGNLELTEQEVSTMLLAYLSSVQEEYCDENGNLPADWMETIFWEEEELLPIEF